jgi:hypothetical protein
MEFLNGCVVDGVVKGVRSKHVRLQWVLDVELDARDNILKVRELEQICAIVVDSVLQDHPATLEFLPVLFKDYLRVGRSLQLSCDQLVVRQT